MGGKGGYWSIVPDYANKLLESSIRKRRSNTYQYDTNDLAKRQRLDLLEAKAMCKLKTEIKHDCDEKGSLTNTLLADDIVNLDSPEQCAIDILSHLEQQCRTDHSYGKSPVVNYNDSDEENIRAIAIHLEGITSSISCSINPEEDTNLVSTNSIFSTFGSAL